jgi:hypothetical protein
MPCPMSLARRIVLGAVILAAAGFHPVTASPSISWSGDRDIVLGLGPGDNTTWFDLNSDGVEDIGFRNYQATMSLVLSPSATATATTEASFHWYGPLDAGTLVGAALDSPLSWMREEDTLVSYMIVDDGEVLGIGPWINVTEGLLGVSFDTDGQTHYGWLRMSDVSSTTFMLHDWAFETQPGLGINAGVVPEPSTMALFAIGLGALGWSRWRRMKRE